MSQTLLDMIEEDIAIAQDIEFSTENIQCPALEASAKIMRISRNSFTSGEDTYHTLTVRWEIDDEGAREVTKQDKVFVDQTMFLKLDEEKSKNMDAANVEDQLWVIPVDGNPDFGKFMKWAKAAKYEMPSSWIKFWISLSDDFVGKEAFVKVKQRLRKTKILDVDGNPETVVQAYIAAVTPE